VRARFPTWAVVALGALTVGALGIAVTPAASDADKWPGWLRPYHHWGWWSVLLQAAEGRWRTVNGPHLVALVRAGARFERGLLVERPAEPAREVAA
jgi:hypothetical protein